jgi:predicted N-acetyltransferase YhbS
MSARVRPLTPADFPFAVALTDTERWGFTVEDFERFLDLSPEGCFVVEADGEPLGLLTSFLYGTVGWIGNVIVSSRARGRKLGAALVAHALAYLEGKGARAVRLWAYENTVGLYAKFGFADDGLDCRRWIGYGHGTHVTPPAGLPADCAVYPLNAITLKAVLPLDRRYFGADRSRVLERILRDHPDASFVARASDGAPVGFIMAKLSPKGCEAGPWIVEPSASKWAIPCLLEAVLHRLAGQSVELGVYGVREDVQNWLVEHGFHAGFRTLRMTRGDLTESVERVEGICAIGGLEKG